MTLTHLNARGEAHMVDVADKQETRREATAKGRIHMLPATLALLVDGGLPKGDVLATARIAGIQAAKRTHELIPLCHALALSKVTLDFDIDPAQGCVHVTAMCRLNGRTGVEMEALTAVSVACLTLYDMCKAVDRGMTIEAVRLELKSGGRSGDWSREPEHDFSPADDVESDGSSVAPAVGPSVIRVRFMAELRERLDAEEANLDIGKLATMDIAGVKRALREQDERYAILSESRILAACNQIMASEETPVTASDEIAFFPPVTGG